MRVVLVCVLLLVLAIGMAAAWGLGTGTHWWTSAQTESDECTDPPLELPNGAARITVAQRSDADVPGSAARLRVHLGDITRGQVELTLAHSDGRTLVATTSVRETDRIPFVFGAQRYHLSVLSLRNRVAGKDTATLEISAGTSQRERIEQLLKAMESSNLTFVRNGKEYEGADAADR